MPYVEASAVIWGREAVVNLAICPAMGYLPMRETWKLSRHAVAITLFPRCGSAT